MNKLWLSAAAVLCTLLPNLAAADELNSADTAWILTATALVLFMTIPGLSLFYAGLVRSKNVLSVLMQCFAITCVASLVWFVCGYSLAYGGGNQWIGTFDKVMLSGVDINSMAGSIPETVYIMFQMTFAIITPALVIGAFAERMKFSAVLAFTVIWVLCVYVPVCHWVWAPEGWLFQKGLLDFAGGTVVHITAGVSALIAAMMIGNRKGFGKAAMPPHNLAMTVTGAGMLWVGWFGFNAGSAIAADNAAGMAMLVTHISAAAGSLAWMTMEWLRHGKPSVLGIVTGMVAGLGTITPASGAVGPGGALIIGLSAGVICYFSTAIIKRGLKIDDSLDVFPVHGVGGILGTLMAGIFFSDQLGVFSGNGQEGVTIADQLGVQVTGVLATIGYTAVVTYVIFKALDLSIGLRVDDDQETEGLDIVLHDERGYVDL